MSLLSSKKRRDISKTELFPPEVFPEVMNNPFLEKQVESKVVKIFLLDHADYEIGYYDYFFGTYMIYKGTESNKKGKVKVPIENILNWKYA